jgi:hypothetical protein
LRHNCFLNFISDVSSKACSSISTFALALNTLRQAVFLRGSPATLRGAVKREPAMLYHPPAMPPANTG